MNLEKTCTLRALIASGIPPPGAAPTCCPRRFSVPRTRARRIPLLVRRHFPPAGTTSGTQRSDLPLLGLQAGRPVAIEGNCKSTTDENFASEVPLGGQQELQRRYLLGPAAWIGDAVHMAFAWAHFISSTA